MSTPVEVGRSFQPRTSKHIVVHKVCIRPASEPIYGPRRAIPDPGERRRSRIVFMKQAAAQGCGASVHVDACPGSLAQVTGIGTKAAHENTQAARPCSKESRAVTLPARSWNRERIGRASEGSGVMAVVLKGIDTALSYVR